MNWKRDKDGNYTSDDGWRIVKDFLSGWSATTKPKTIYRVIDADDEEGEFTFTLREAKEVADYWKNVKKKYRRKQ